MATVNYRNYEIEQVKDRYICHELSINGASLNEVISTLEKKRFHIDLVNALKAAEKAALEADPGPGLENDGGTCNMDSPMIYLPGVRAAKITAAAKEAGIEVDRLHGRAGEWFVRTTTNGQANRRTLMARAACKAIKLAGFQGRMFFHAD